MGIDVIKESDPYARPSPNMQLMTSFLPVAICRPHSAGIGRITTTKSWTKLIIAIARSRALRLPQEPPWIVKSHRRATGRQMRHSARIAEARKSRLKAKAP